MESNVNINEDFSIKYWGKNSDGNEYIYYGAANIESLMTAQFMPGFRFVSVLGNMNYTKSFNGIYKY
jgi:hypothetical protein